MRAEMNYAVNSEYRDGNQLIITPRKRSLKQSLLYVKSGLVLLRLGKAEYAIEPDQAWWIPADCLMSLTFLPNSKSLQLDFSQRLTQSFPTQSGCIALTTLAQQGLERLATLERDHPLYSPIAELLKYEAAHCKPKLIDSPLSQAISRWQPLAKTDQMISAELHLALLLREARKLELSGRNESHVASLWFNGNLEQYQQLKSIFLL
jgi:hypothetical protein